MLSLTYSNKQLTGRQFVCVIGTGENRCMSVVAKGPIQLSWPVLQNIQRWYKSSKNKNKQRESNYKQESSPEIIMY